MKTALFIVNPQMDFMPKGSLEVTFGDKIIPVINSFIDKFDIVIASRDWYPENHLSFITQHEGTKILDVVQVEGKNIIIQPPHCIQNTEGAKFHPDLNFNGELFTKGDNPYEQTSGYVGINSDGKTVEQYLKENEVECVYVVGLAGDYSVKDSAVDCSNNFKTYLIIDAIKFIGSPDDTIKLLMEKGVSIINSNDLTFTLSKEKIHKIAKVKKIKKDDDIISKGDDSVFSPRNSISSRYASTTTSSTSFWTITPG